MRDLSSGRICSSFNGLFIISSVNGEFCDLLSLFIDGTSNERLELVCAATLEEENWATQQTGLM